jgi:hypothetical protein
VGRYAATLGDLCRQTQALSRALGFVSNGRASQMGGRVKWEGEALGLPTFCLIRRVSS